MFTDSVLFNIFITELGQSCQAGHTCRWCEAGRDRKIQWMREGRTEKMPRGWEADGNLREKI